MRRNPLSRGSGDCLGNFWINKDLTIQGTPSATLDGIDSGTTLQVYGGASALLENLTVTGGFSTRIGGGVWVASGSSLTLLDSSVVGNWVWSSTNNLVVVRD